MYDNDLLSGRPFIGGKQLGKLPQDMVRHPTYTGKSVFGAVSLEIFHLPPFRTFLEVLSENS